MRTYDDLVNDYLHGVEQALADVPADRRAALLSDLSQHIATKRAELSSALSSASPTTEARTLLELLGDPAEVAAALAAEDAPPPPMVIEPRSKASAVIWVALSIGAVATMCVAAGLLGLLLLT